MSGPAALSQLLEVWHQIGYDNDFLVVVCHGMMPPLGQGVGGPPDSLINTTTSLFNRPQHHSS